jgi:sodium-dependent dicarboxylate transporter 2/3/5
MKTSARKSITGLLLCAILIIAAEIMPLADGVTRVGLLSLAVFFGTILMWILNSLPMCVTALLMMFLMPGLGVMKLEDVYSSFGGTAFFFAIATFCNFSGIGKHVCTSQNMQCSDPLGKR